MLLTQGNAKIVSLADRWATWIVVIALLAAVGTYVVTGEIIRAVTILVVFCPCAPRIGNAGSDNAEIPHLVALSKRMMTSIKINLSFSLCF